MTEWQDIATAPKDGTTILVYGHPTSKESVRYHCSAIYTAAWDEIDEAYGLSGGDWTGPFIDPTHWMPLPLPPEAK